jgi:hypothetical protein
VVCVCHYALSVVRLDRIDRTIVEYLGLRDHATNRAVVSENPVTHAKLRNGGPSARGRDRRIEGKGLGMPRRHEDRQALNLFTFEGFEVPYNRLRMPGRDIRLVHSPAERFHANPSASLLNLA